MMKENKKKGLRKVLLMAASVVLVAAVSVAATLAYLTAMTGEKTNNFKAATNDLNGGVYEPAWTADKTGVVPGDSFPKDPMVQNTTKGVEMYTGVKVKFKINDIYVPWSTFKKYVSLSIDQTYTWTDEVGYADDFNTGASGKTWANVTGTTLITSASTKDANALYFIYNTKLEAAGTSAPSSNHTASQEGDTTEPLFQYVHINENINVNPGASTKVANTAEGYAGVSAANLVAANRLNQNFEKLDFAVEVTGYGISATAYPTLNEDAEKVILKGLGVTYAA